MSCHLPLWLRIVQAQQWRWPGNRTYSHPFSARGPIASIPCRKACAASLQDCHRPKWTWTPTIAGLRRTHRRRMILGEQWQPVSQRSRSARTALLSSRGDVHGVH